MNDPASSAAGQPWAAAIDGVERQIERGSLFTHSALSETAERLTEVEALLHGVLDVLIGNRTIEPVSVAAAAAAVRHELDARGETVSPGVTLRADEPAGTGVVPVDCAARMHVCQAICCRLHFALTAAEVESGTVKWDLGRPYHIRQDRDGTCVHNDPDSHGCGVYAQRPGVCQGYSCADDERIWSDFGAMRLNTAWIEQNLHGTRPRLARSRMVPLPDPVYRPEE
jgi:hypothetical protein